MTLVRTLSMKPQSRTVFNHLEKYGNISVMEAMVSYGITRLAACIHDIRKAGFNVVSDYRHDATGHGYTRYYFEGLPH